MGASGSVQDQNRFNRMGSASGGALTDLYGKMQQGGMYGSQTPIPAQLTLINPTRGGMSDKQAESLDRRGLYYVNTVPMSSDRRARQGKDGSETAKPGAGRGAKIYAPERFMPSQPVGLPGQNMRQGK